MTPQMFRHKFDGYEAVPCCLHSFARAEHGPDSPYPILSDITSFPSFTKGKRTGRFFVTSQCPCAAPLKDEMYDTVELAQAAWREIVQRQLNGCGVGVSE